MEGKSLLAILSRLGGRFIVMQTNLGPHYAEETLERYALGNLLEELIAPLEDHIMICEPCQKQLHEVEQFLDYAAAAAKEIRTEATQAKAPLPGLAWFKKLTTVPMPAWGLGFAAIVMVVVISSQHPQGEPQVVNLASYRGLEQSIPAHGDVVLKLNTVDLRPAQAFRVQVVSASGTEVWHGQAIAEANGDLQVKVGKSLSAGQYWVRLFETTGDSMLREYPLPLK